MGYLMLFHFLKEKYGLDVTWSTYASEGGNFGSFTSHEVMKRLNAKMYLEARRLGVKWILAASAAICGGNPSVHGHPERPATSWKYRSIHHRHALRKRGVHQDGASLRIHRRPDQARKLDLKPERNDNKIITFTIRATRRVAWACSTSRAT